MHGELSVRRISNVVRKSLCLNLFLVSGGPVGTEGSKTGLPGAAHLIASKSIVSPAGIPPRPAEL